MRVWLNTPRTGGVAALAACLAVVFALIALSGNNFYYDVAIRAGLNAVICVGLNLLIGYAGQISLGHAGFLGLGAYSSAVLAEQFGLPPVVGMFVGALMVGLLAFVVGRPILRLKGHYLAMGTLGMGIIISIVVNTEDQVTGGPDGMTVPPLNLFGWEVYGEGIWYGVAAVALLAVVWMAQNLIASPMGRALQAVHGSEVAAEVCGVDVARYKLLVFVISAVFASVAGSLGAHYGGFITPADVGFFKSIELVTMVVLGGMASTYGAVVGAVILTVLPQLLTDFADYEHLVFGLILMLTMIFMPKGLVPTLVAFVRGRGEPAP